MIPAYRRLLLGCLLCLPAHSASLSGNLVSSEIDQLTQSIGFPSTTRLLRSSEAYPSWPGAKIGAEIVAAGSGSIGGFGDRTGSSPALTIVPRIFLAKGLFSDLEILLAFFPAGSPTGITTMGGILKWSFYHEDNSWFTAAAFMGYTQISAFAGDFEGDDVEFGVSFSKDFVRIRPYLGGGVLAAKGSVKPGLAATAARSSLQTTLHLFAGVELELPVNVTFQFDLMNLTPMATFFIGKRF